MGDSELLFRALVLPDISKLKSLLRSGEDVNAQNDSGWSLLSVAAHHGKPDLVNLLLQYKADVNPEGRLPINEAILKRRFDIVKTLVNNGADINEVDKYHMSPLGLAAKFCYVEVVHYLIKCGADINKRGKKGNTVLHFAVAGGNLEIIKTLIKNDADLLVPNSSGKTVLEYAVRRMYKYISRLLIQHILLRNPNMPRPDVISSHSVFFDQWDVYKDEVDKMIIFKFGGSKISLREFMFENNIHRLVGYLSNINIHTFEELQSLCEYEFPRYSDIIVEKFREGKIRECFLQKCYIVFKHSELKKLSVEIKHCITRFLGNNDLSNIVKAALYESKPGSSSQCSSSSTSHLA